MNKQVYILHTYKAGLNIIKLSSLKLIYKCNTIQNQNASKILCVWKGGTYKNLLKFIWARKCIRIAKKNGNRKLMK
jgi:hypothetical protein